MITWKLWRVLVRPPLQHPLVRHTIKILTPPPKRGGWRILNLALTLFAWLFLAIVILGLLRDIDEVIADYLLFILHPNAIWLFFIPLWSIMVYGSPTSSRPFQIIKQKYAQKTHDFFCLFPGGILVTHWFIFIGCLHFRHAFRNVHLLVRGFLLFLTVTLALALGVHNMPQGMFGLALALLDTVIFVVVLYIDYTQSIILCVMINLLFTTTFVTSSDSYNWGGALYVALQCVIYSLAILLRMVLLPDVFMILNFSGWVADLMMLFIWLIPPLLLREWIIIRLWHILSRRFKTNLNALAPMTVLPQSVIMKSGRTMES